MGKTHSVSLSPQDEGSAHRRIPHAGKDARRQQIQLQLLTDALPVLVSYVDRDQRFRFNNRAYEDWFGCRREDVYGKCISDVLGDDASAVILPYVEHALAGLIVTYEGKVCYKNAGERFIHATYVPHRENGDVEGCFVLVSDLTERRNTKEALKSSTQEVRKLNEELERRVLLRTWELEQANAQLKKEIAERRLAEEHLSHKAQELARSNAELERFAYAASHDLKEPLRMVSTYTGLLAKRYKGRLDRDADEFIGYASEGAARMEELIRDILAHSRLDSGTTIKPVETTAVLHRAMDNLQAAIRENDAAVTYDALPIVRGDATQLIQLFQNLIANAIKFRGLDPPRIHVSAQRKTETTAQHAQEIRRSSWLFAVTDNGIGIEPRYFERIFQMFQRLHARQEYAGSGIGLASCKKIVEGHGGRIWVESKPGRGSTFFFTLPCAR